MLDYSFFNSPFSEFLGNLPTNTNHFTKSITPILPSRQNGFHHKHPLPPTNQSPPTLRRPRNQKPIQHPKPQLRNLQSRSPAKTSLPMSTRSNRRRTRRTHTRLSQKRTYALLLRQLRVLEIRTARITTLDPIWRIRGEFTYE
jgi:hypothetical protein